MKQKAKKKDTTPNQGVTISREEWEHFKKQNQRMLKVVNDLINKKQTT
jgi:hypothetical protein